MFISTRIIFLHRPKYSTKCARSVQYDTSVATVVQFPVPLTFMGILTECSDYVATKW